MINRGTAAARQVLDFNWFAQRDHVSRVFFSHLALNDLILHPLQIIRSDIKEFLGDEFRRLVMMMFADQ